MMRKMEEESFIGKAIPDKELEAMRRKTQLDDQALSKPAGALARRPETRKEDETHYRSPSVVVDQVLQRRRASLVAAVTTARTRIKMTHELRVETLRVSKEHED